MDIKCQENIAQEICYFHHAEKFICLKIHFNLISGKTGFRLIPCKYSQD